MSQLIKTLRFGACVLVLLSACSKDPNPDHDPSEKAKAISVASRYLEAFVAGNAPLALEMSDAPFWGDGDLIPDRASLKIAMAEEIGEMRSLAYRFKGGAFLTFDELKVLNPEMAAELSKARLGELYAVAVLIEVNGDEESGMVLLHKDAAGMWKVIGMGD